MIKPLAMSIQGRRRVPTSLLLVQAQGHGEFPIPVIFLKASPIGPYFLLLTEKEDEHSRSPSGRSNVQRITRTLLSHPIISIPRNKSATYFTKSYANDPTLDTTL
ncbi:hypothetical protein F9C07_2099214 [Aspergillus flavus]|uniref:Uncharacterized protein n=1 Tax=Aspergillus flavus (strain ATCC 200026 / FGSC A1120 / IAM 13836 / NRRL 3357 / JCM 12722 / SRRC 167) TaxID=332952 RepID=A0A7U2MD48_ASPFN|nr:hypothetical protein F9C07_2099214 [Aspergillus flavus]